MTVTDILQILQLGEKLGYKATIIVHNILGVGQYVVDYENYKIDNNKVFYNKGCAVQISDVVSVRIGK